MGHIRPFSIRPGGIQSIPSDILRSVWWGVLFQLQQETGHREAFDLSFEEFVAGSEESTVASPLSSILIFFKNSGVQAMY
jgi:hypothetical protein